VSRPATAYTDERASAEYWAFQEQVGRVGGELNRWKFIDYVTASDVVLDFGCGGGYLIAGLPARERLGVEPNPNARAEAERNGIRVYERAADVESGAVDVVISHGSLEHVLSPFEELIDLKRALRPGGRAILDVPSTDWREKSERHAGPGDQNHEFYSWTPQLFWNLLEEVGFEPESVKLLTHAWHPRISLRMARLPRPLYSAHAWLLAVTLRRREVFAVATKSVP
jgi:SAM-dependent methyltransferase